MGWTYLASWTLALALHAPEPAVVGPSLPRAESAVPGAADDNRGSRRWGRAAVVVALSGVSFGGMITTQILRDSAYQDCLRSMAHPDPDVVGRIAEGFGCDLAPIAPGFTAGAAVLAPITVALAAGGGAILGHGDVDYGVQQDATVVHRKLRNAAIGLAVAGSVIGVSAILYGVQAGLAPSAGGLAFQRMRFVVTDAAVVTAALSAGVLARANTYRRRTKLAIAPIFGGRTHGISLSGRF
jgi:hypothetical protein